MPSISLQGNSLEAARGSGNKKLKVHGESSCAIESPGFKTIEGKIRKGSQFPWTCADLIQVELWEAVENSNEINGRRVACVN